MPYDSELNALPLSYPQVLSLGNLRLLTDLLVKLRLQAGLEDKHDYRYTSSGRSCVVFMGLKLWDLVSTLQFGLN